nr:hypothetical protein BaRGS_002536 [Batillaria attramentaria]
MDSLTSMNIVPFMGLLSLLEAKYLHIPEIFHTLIAILCDFNPLVQENVNRTKRYLRALLSREPELVQCLLTFLDEPQFITDPGALSATE